MFTCLDHDDGSDYYLDTRNVCVFAGMKNYIGQNKIWDSQVMTRKVQCAVPSMRVDAYNHASGCIHGTTMRVDARCSSVHIELCGPDLRNLIAYPDGAFSQNRSGMG